MEEQITILCVDDEKNVLKALERFFLDSDYEIITAGSAEEGLEVLKSGETIQVVMSDYRMPGMNGVDFLKEVFQHWPDTIRLVLSGYAETASIVSAINEGQIFRFIPKPWNDDELTAAIANAVECYRIKRKNIQLTDELRENNMKLQEMNDNLEKIVAERTSELMMQNKILTCSQNILDALPVAVLGIDPEGFIAQCNKMGHELINHEEGDALGLDRRDSLSGEINSFIDKTIGKEMLAETISLDGSSISVKGVHMKHQNNQETQEGIILVFDEVGNHE